MKHLLEFKQFILEAEDTYNDYPAAAKANAKKAIDWKEKYGRDVVKGGTAVGWQRAHQLAKGEKLSRDVVSRMAQFNRHRKNSKIDPEYKEEPWRDNGYIAWLIWGGDEGVDWAMQKMDEIKESKTSMKKVKLFEEFISNESVNENLSAEQKQVERFLKKIAKEFGYSMQDAARFVQDTISKMGLKESMNEEATQVTPESDVVVDDYTMDDAETVIKSTEIVGAIVSSQSEDEFLDYFYKEYGNSAFTESDISTLITYYQEYREEVNAEEAEAEKEAEEAESGDSKDPLADLDI